MKFGYIKVGAYTPEIKVADCSYNVQSIICGINTAKDNGVKILVMPELCVTGYTCADLFYQKILLDGAIDGVKEIAKNTQNSDMLVFVGAPYKIDDKLFNCAFALHRGEIVGIVPKTHIPDYNEYSEKRYFASGKNVKTSVYIDGKEIPFGTDLLFSDPDFSNCVVGAEICEDLWAVNPTSTMLANNGATIIANLSASNETVGKAQRFKSFISSQSARLVCGYVSANAGEGESTTDLVFAGHNLICENGKVLNESQLFSTGLITSEIDVDFLNYERTKTARDFIPCDEQFLKIPVNFDKVNTKLTRIYPTMPFVPNESKMDERASLVLQMQAQALKKRIIHTNTKSLVIGVSGGLDSSLALLVAVKAMKLCNRDTRDIIAVTMPCYGTTKRTYNNAKQLADALGVTLRKVNIAKAVDRHFIDIGHDKSVTDVTFENAQARERTQVLMDIANQTGGMVIGTGDLSELALGWATYNGDHMSMYGVNCSVPKTLIRYLVAYYVKTENNKLGKVLADILATPVSPELLPAKDGEIAQVTEDIVGPYELHDFYLYYFVRMGFAPSKIYEIATYTFEGKYTKETIYKWLKTFLRRFFIQQFKRSCVPDGVKIGSVGLSPRGDWKMPTDAVSAMWINELDEYVKEN